MLRIVGIQEDSRATVVVDSYVPLDVELGGAECPGKLYWRALWQAEALLEVGVHPETGALVTVTLTSIPRSHIKQGQASLPSSRGEGLPRAAVRGGKGRTRDAFEFLRFIIRVLADLRAEEGA
jgi:hypothetical protein